MIRLFFLLIFFLGGSPYSLKADELDNIKDPFDDGLPKPVVVKPEPPAVHHEEPKPMVIYRPQAQAVVGPVVTLPRLDLQGVIVGEEVHEAIINDQVVPLLGTIDGARVISITKHGVEMSFRGKKFFLKVD